MRRFGGSASIRPFVSREKTTVIGLMCATRQPLLNPQLSTINHIFVTSNGVLALNYQPSNNDDDTPSATITMTPSTPLVTLVLRSRLRSKHKCPSTAWIAPLENLCKEILFLSGVFMIHTSSPLSLREGLRREPARRNSTPLNLLMLRIVNHSLTKRILANFPQRCGA